MLALALRARRGQLRSFDQSIISNLYQSTDYYYASLSVPRIKAHAHSHARIQLHELLEGVFAAERVIYPRVVEGSLIEMLLAGEPGRTS